MAMPRRLGQGHIGLNSYFLSTREEKFCTYMEDVKDVGNWYDQADGADMNGQGSVSKYTYTHTNDDSVKIGGSYQQRSYATALSGQAGSPLGVSYGDIPSGIAFTNVKDMYVHRILQHGNANQCAQGTQVNNKGLIALQSCGCEVTGLKNFVLDGFYVPSLGSNQQGANSVTVPLGVGVLPSAPVKGAFCDCPIPLPAQYPIQDIKLHNVVINVNPQCPSNFFVDPTYPGRVQWGATNTAAAAVKMFKGTVSPTTCDYSGELLCMFVLILIQYIGV